jgi:class III poly(R)-hydroxyalkanoic acid synthase PhaE subunit
MNTQWPGAGPDSSFESIARQYWTRWGDAMRQGAGASTAGAPNWQDAIDWWSRLAQGQSGDANSVVDRFNAQARDWYGQMQQIAAQFAGQDAKPSDIAGAWKRAMGGFGDNPFASVFQSMQGQGAQGMEQWTEAVAPWLDAWRRESRTLLGMPTFGIGREQQERWQALTQAQLDYQQQDAAYNALMLKALQDAYTRFEKKLAERDAPGRQLTSARALFDLWIDAAEDAYADMALSPAFRDAYGARVNAQMKLRQAVQGEVERMSETMGMPTRSDLDAAFRKITDLERALRKLQDQVLHGKADARQPAASTTKASADKANVKPARTAARKKTSGPTPKAAVRKTTAKGRKP